MSLADIRKKYGLETETKATSSSLNDIRKKYGIKPTELSADYEYQPIASEYSADTYSTFAPKLNQLMTDIGTSVKGMNTDGFIDKSVFSPYYDSAKDYKTQTDDYIKYFENNRGNYDEATVNEIISSLQGVSESLGEYTDLADYWNYWDNEAQWDTFQNYDSVQQRYNSQMAEQSRLQAEYDAIANEVAPDGLNRNSKGQAYVKWQEWEKNKQERLALKQAEIDALDMSAYTPYLEQYNTGKRIEAAQSKADRYDIEKALTRLDMLYNSDYSNADLQNAEKYEAVWLVNHFANEIPKADDFETYSNMIVTPEYVTNNTTGILASLSLDEDYEYINKVGNSQGGGLTKEEKAVLDSIPKDQIAIYNYIYAKYGAKMGQTYLNQIKDGMSYYIDAQNKAKEYVDNYTYQYGTNIGKNANFVQKLGIAAEQGWDSFFENTVTAMTGDIEKNSANDYAFASARENSNWLGKLALDMAQTGANMAPSVLLSAMTSNLLGGGVVAGEIAKIVGSGAMGVSATGGAYKEAIDKGLNEEQAKTYSVLVGAAESGLNYLLGGIGKMGGKLTGKAFGKAIAGIDKTLLRIAAQTGVNALGEGVEEGLQEILSPIFEYYVTGSNYDSAKTEDVLYSALLGALMGATGGISDVDADLREQVISERNNVELDRERIATMATQFLSYPEETAAHVVGVNLQQLLDTNKTIMSSDVQKIFADSKNAGMFRDYMAGTYEDMYGKPMPKTQTTTQPTVNDLARTKTAENGAETDNLADDYKNSVNRVILEQSAKYGEAGADRFNAIWEIQGHRLDAAEYIKAMDEAYYAGKNGTEYSFEGHSVEPDVAKLMYEAGVTDAEIAKIDKGFVPTKAAEGVDSKLVNRLDKIAKAFNVKIAFTDELRGGLNNGQYRNGTILIARDAVKPYMVVAKHEITHHLKTVAPEAFKKYADYAVKTLALGRDTEAVINARIAKANGKMSRDVAIEELAADFTEKILGDRDSLTSFINEMNKTAEGRKAANRFFEAIANFIKKIKEIFRGDVAKVRGKAIDSLNYGQGAKEIVAQLEEAEALWKELAKTAITESENAKTKNTADDSGVRHSEKERITENSTDKEREEILKQKYIVFPFYKLQADSFIKNEKANIESTQVKLVKAALLRIADEFNAFKNYTVKDIDLEISFSKGNLKESVSKKINPTQIAKLLPILEETVKNAVGIERHLNRYFYDNNTISFDVLLGGYIDGDNIVPVRFGLKNSTQGNHVLYVIVDQEKIKTEVLAAPFLHVDTTEAAHSVKISVTDIVRFVNNGDILRYLPDGMLNSNQKEIKWQAIAETIKNTNNKNDKKYAEAVAAGNIVIAERMVKEAAKAAGYTNLYYHGAKKGGGFTVFRDWSYFTENKQYAERYADRDNAEALYKTYVKMDKAFDTRKAADRKLFNKIREIYGMSNIQDSGLPDWTDGYDLADYIDENDLDYDGIVLDEGGDMVNGKPVSRGLSYVVRKSAQIKSADPVTYDDNGNVIPLSQRFNENEDDIRYSEKDSDIDPLEVLRKQYGTIKPGESPFRVNVEVPKKTEAHKKVSQTVRTVMEAEATPDVALPTIEKMIADGQFSFEVLPDDIAVNTAKAVINKHGWSSAVANWFASVSKGEVSKNNTAMGWVLYNNAVNAGDISLAMDILDAMVRHQRNAAQALQATRILKKLSPEAQMYSVQKSVQQMQEELVEKYGEKAPNLKIDKKLVEEYLDQTNEDKRNDVLVRIYQDIGRQLPSTFADKWNAWRYLAMLGNPKTHIKNILGNAVFAPLVVSKNALATLIEAATYKISGGSLQRTKAIPDKELLSAAWEDYKIVADEIVAGGKYNDRANANRHIEEGRVIFKGENIVSRGVEGARVLNSKALDKEDAWFAQPHYAMALAQYCKANNISAEVLRGTKRSEQAKANEARVYAIKEAQKATYRDLNAFSQLVSSWGQKDRANTSAINVAKNAANLVVNGTIPFKKTPANILVRAVEYSPIGLVKSLTWDIAKLNNETLSRKFGKVSGAQIIDRVASGITGTMILALGFVLSKLGLVRGRGGDEEEEIYHEELIGHQGYSLEIGDISITLDWLAPESIPFFMGVNLFEAAAQKEITFADAWAVVTNLSEPMLEMSCLQGINEVFEGTAFLSKDYLAKLPAALISATTNYITQAFPTILGQAERTAQKERQTTYVTKGGLPAEWQRTLGKISAKVPGWDYQQIPYIDAWGRLEKTPNMLSNLANNAINPAYVSSIEETDMDLELLRLFEATGEGSVLPDRAGKTFKVKDAQGNSIDKNLTAKEYVKYATMRGTAAYEMMTEMTASQEYLNLPDDEKVEVISDIYSYANAYAKAKLTAAEENKFVMTSWMSKAQVSAKSTGIPMWKYILIRNQSNNINGITVNGETYENSGSLQIMEYIYSIKGLTTEQRNALFADLGVGKKVIHYNKNLVDTKLRLIRSMANK